MTSSIKLRYTRPTVMEDQISQEQVAQQGPPQSPSFGSQTKAKSGGSKWLIIFIVLLILGGAGIFFFTSSANKPIATPTPSFGVVPIEDKETSTPMPTKSPEPVKKDTITIEIQNGTGITGEAKLLQDKLKSLGYTEITVGNAPTTDNTETTVTFKKGLAQSAQDELKKELESFYKTVNIKTSSTQKTDVVVITGLRGSQTTKPLSSSTPKSTATASSSATPKATSTPAAN